MCADLLLSLLRGAYGLPELTKQKSSKALGERLYGLTVNGYIKENLVAIIATGNMIYHVNFSTWIPGPNLLVKFAT